MAENVEQSPWLARTQEALSKSTTYIDSNYRTTWQDNIRAFHSQHHVSSKFNSAAYQFKSRLFRPKTRAVSRRNEAAVAAAYFSNAGVIDVEPQNPADPIQRASADMAKYLVKHRLTYTIPWYVTLIGGFQDAHVIGVVCSYQSWKYRREKVRIEAETSNPLEKSVEEEIRVVENRPDCQIIPIENVRIDSSADWVDPIVTSPYVLRFAPMYAMDVQAMAKDNGTGQPTWNALSEGQLRGARKLQWDQTRLARLKNREDTYNKDMNAELKPFDIIWCIENFMRWNGQEMCYWTCGSEYMLSDPIPLREAYLHGERPLVMGVGVIETHRIFPSSMTELGLPIQNEMNDVGNERRDNVKLVLNKRYIVKTGTDVDLQSLLRNVAGSITMAGNPDTDVKELEWNDVTSSSYAEQDRLNTDFDELVGTFSASSVATNRKLNETVGGMNMLRTEAGGLTEYLVRTFNETWTEKVIRQFVLLEQYYEDDEELLTLAAQEVGLMLRYGVEDISEEFMQQKLNVSVDVGLGATDPLTKVERFLFAIKTIVEIQTKLKEAGITDFDMTEIRKEVFGRLGYKDGSRFTIDTGDDQANAIINQVIQEMQVQIQQLAAALQDQNLQRQHEYELTRVKEGGQNIRKAAELENAIVLKDMDLRNPVVGEKIPANQKK